MEARLTRTRAKPWLPTRKALVPAQRTVTPEQVAALAAQGMRTQQIAITLRCSRVTVWRIAREARISLVRPARIRGIEQWQAVYVEHGPTSRGIARALGMDPTYVHRQLQGHGLIPTPGAAVEEDVA